MKCNPLKPLEERIFLSASLVSQKLFKGLYEKIKDLNHEIYYSDLNKEYCITNGKKKVFLDFYDKTKNVLIEFYGDYWHANPILYDKDDFITNPLCKEKSSKVFSIWKKDYERIKFIQEQVEGIKVVIIWEHDFNKNPEEIIEYCMSQLKD